MPGFPEKREARFSRFFALCFDAESVRVSLYFLAVEGGKMRVWGEAYWFFNVWMNYLVLLLSACVTGRLFRPVRALLASSLGAVYAMLAWGANQSFLRSGTALCLCALSMVYLAFGKGCFRMLPVALAVGLFFSGFAQTILQSKLPIVSIPLISGLIPLAAGMHVRQMNRSHGAEVYLRFTLQGKAVMLPAMRDSGNLLRDGLTGIPVIVVPAGRMKALLPDPVRADDLSTLPPGWRLISVRTVSGRGLLMCFRPDQTELIGTNQGHWVEAMIAVSPFPGEKALVPETLFQGFHAVSHIRKREKDHMQGVQKHAGC